MTRPAFVPARRYPFDAPTPRELGKVAGVLSADGEAWCVECAPLSLDWSRTGRRLPVGWRRIDSPHGRKCSCCGIKLGRRSR